MSKIEGKIKEYSTQLDEVNNKIVQIKKIYEQAVIDKNRLEAAIIALNEIAEDNQDED